MIKGYDNFFTSKFKDITEGFTVDEDIPGENSIPSDPYTNPIVNNTNKSAQNISNTINRNTVNTPSRNNLKLDIIKDLSSTLKKIENKSNPSISQPMMSNPISQPMTTEPMMTNPMMTNPMMTNPMMTEPMMTNPMTTEPMMTNPMTTEPMMTNPMMTNPMMTNPMMTEPMMTNPMTTEPMTTQPDELTITQYQELINNQTQQDIENAKVLAENNKKRNQLNKRLNNINNNSKNNNSQMKNNNKYIEEKFEDIIEEEDIIQEEDFMEEEEDIIEEEDIMEEGEIEGFTNLKEGFNGSMIIKNSNNRLLLLTILITFLAYLFCHKITKTFITKNIKSLDRLLTTGGVLQDNTTLINMILFSVVVFILLKVL